jgi:thiol-disulfide isomerase/thioredoxin
LLDFWATWCLPCVAEMPILERVHRQLGTAGRAFTLLGINTDGDGVPPAALAKFLREHAISYTNLVDDGAVAGDYDVDVIPHMVLIDHNGLVRRTFDGAVGERELVREVEKVLP